MKFFLINIQTVIYHFVCFLYNKYYDDNSVLSLRILIISLKSLSADSIDCIEELRNFETGKNLPRLFNAVNCLEFFW